MKNSQLNIKWFQAASALNLDEDIKENLEKSIRASSGTMNLLLKILVLEKKNLLKTAQSDYADASWAYRQADVNGQIRQLDRLINLIDLEGNYNNDPT